MSPQNPVLDPEVLALRAQLAKVERERDRALDAAMRLGDALLVLRRRSRPQRGHSALQQLIGGAS